MPVGDDFIALSLLEFKRLKDLAERAMAQIGQEDYFRSQSELDNSVPAICKHMAGNLRSRWTDFLTSDGEKPWRRRDDEFRIHETDTREVLMERWEASWAILLAELGRVGGEELGRLVTIRGETLSVLQAIGRQLTHYAYHVGQIVYVCKSYAGGSWKSLSIPLGQSEAFNAAPAKYIGEGQSPSP